MAVLDLDKKEVNAKIVFYGPALSGKTTNIHFIYNKLKPEHRVKVLKFIRLLEELGPTLPRPYADLLTDGIHELRVKLSGEQVRLLYFFCFERYIVFFDILHKHSDRVPEAVIRRTGLYRDRLLAVMNPSVLEEAARADA